MTNLAYAPYNKHIMWASKQKVSGFTIIEVIVVVIVISILATVITVAYQESQARARFATYKSDLVRINEAITVFHAENGRYPLGDGVTTSGSNCVTGTSSFMSSAGLVPSYINPMPKVVSGGNGSYYAYCWRNNGEEYKLIRLVSSPNTLPAVEANDKSITIDPTRSTRGWGYWSPGGSGL